MVKIEGMCVRNVSEELEKGVAEISAENKGDGSISTDEIGCGIMGCASICLVQAKVRNMKLVDVKTIYKGGNCMKNS
jgi:hypothetical protein